MGVYIPGMKMPTEEAVGIFLYPDGRAHLWRTSGMVGQQYEAVPVPEHGRLIDADALNYTLLYKENWMLGTGVEAPAIWKKDIDAAPTIIPADPEEEKMK